MTHTGSVEYIYQEEDKILIAVLTGNFDKERFKEIIGNIRKLSFEKGYNTLYDLKDCIVDYSVANAYYFPRFMQKEYSNYPPRKVAVMASPHASKEFWDFYETSSINSGLILKVFQTWEEGLHWLRH